MRDSREVTETAFRYDGSRRGSAVLCSLPLINTRTVHLFETQTVRKTGHNSKEEVLTQFSNSGS